MESNPSLLEELIFQVHKGQKYSQISTQLIRTIGVRELASRRTLKDAVKATRNKLHQVSAAYQEQRIPYDTWLAEIRQLPASLDHMQSHTFLRACMQAHASTRERLPILPDFYTTVLRDLGPVRSILDLACGLNPLTIPWMPCADELEYTACDIYEDMVDFLNAYFDYFKIRGAASVCNLIDEIPDNPVQLALVLKTIPCLEQVDKDAGSRILRGLNAENILVTFPAHSLGGRSKGMVTNYENHFNQLMAGTPWKVSRFEFPGELAFLIRK